MKKRFALKLIPGFARIYEFYTLTEAIKNAQKTCLFDAFKKICIFCIIIAHIIIKMIKNIK